jgi:hypothetical protein
MYAVKAAGLSATCETKGLPDTEIFWVLEHMLYVHYLTKDSYRHIQPINLSLDILFCFACHSFFKLILT